MDRQPRRGKGQPAVQLDARLAPAGSIFAQQVAETALRIAKLPRLRGNKSGDFDGPIALAENGNGIVVGVGAIKLMGAAALQMQLQLAEFRLGNYNRIFRQGDVEAVLAAGLREKHAV